MGRSQKGEKKAKGADQCVVPNPLPAHLLDDFVFQSSPREERLIREYVQSQARREVVVHLEKVATERLFERKLDAWDVQTDKERYWVITNPTNLYLHSTFPSLDFAITVHIGLTTRVLARQQPEIPGEEKYRFAIAWRRWTEAARALEEADEAEEFQAVGMRCRECLLKFIQSAADSSMVPSGQELPKRSDFVRWSELIAETVARGASADPLRGYLKSVSKSTWQLVNWLTHGSNAVRLDAQIAVDATQSVLSGFGTALVRYERGVPDRCPSCSSYRISSDYQPELGISPPYVTVCEACGWAEAGKISPEHD